MARESSRRLFETAFLSLASPFLSEARLRRMIEVSDTVIDCFRNHHESPHPLLVATPHMAYWESLTWLSLFLPVPMREFGVIFRPLDNPTADAWVKSTRERYGMRLLSRKEGLTESFRILKRDGTVGVLFDQNAGNQGALTTLLGRVCSTTELPGMLVARSRAKLVTFYPRRLGFWRIRFELTELAHDGSGESATLALNRWLETALASDENLCASWLWSHARWRHQDAPHARFRLESKRNLLAADLAARGATALARKTRLWIRLPNWLGDVVMAVPLLRALRQARPDAEITFIAKGAFVPLLEETGLADRILRLPPRGWGYFRHFRRLRSEYPDTYVLLTHSARGDIEAWLTKCRQRFGLVKPGRRRPLLTHRYEVPADFDEQQHHQLELWGDFFQHFGLVQPADCTSLPRVAPKNDTRIIGFIAGSENNPEKRWPVEHWRALAEKLLAQSDVEILLFGTANDRAITDRIAAGFPAGRIRNLAGSTDLPAYVAKLRECAALITNDTGGMHLANLLGVPLIALFGPTNPLRTGPVFSAPHIILQSPDCPPAGGGSLSRLLPDTVFAALDSALKPTVHVSP